MIDEKTYDDIIQIYLNLKKNKKFCEQKDESILRQAIILYVLGNAGKDGLTKDKLISVASLIESEIYQITSRKPSL